MTSLSPTYIVLLILNGHISHKNINSSKNISHKNELKHHPNKNDPKLED